MKTALIIIATILILPLAPAEEALPPDVQRVLDQRDAAVAKIDKSCLQELEKLKVNYTKQGNLNTANAILSLIAKLDIEKKDPIVGKWERTKIEGTWNFLSDGTGKYVAGREVNKLHWKQVSDREYYITFDNRPGWNRQFLLDVNNGLAEEVEANGRRIQSKLVKPF